MSFGRGGSIGPCLLLTDRVHSAANCVAITSLVGAKVGSQRRFGDRSTVCVKSLRNAFSADLEGPRDEVDEGTRAVALLFLARLRKLI